MTTLEKKLLAEANVRLERKNRIYQSDYNLNIREFVLTLFNYCDPCKYGAVLPKKIYHDSGGKLHPISSSLRQGDATILSKVYYEIKFSFLNSHENTYNLRNIRVTQDFDYFIIGLVDTNDDFRLRIYCVDKEVITNNPNIKLSAQNGTDEENKKNKIVPQGKMGINGDLLIQILEEHNVYKGNTYDDLLQYLNNKTNSLLKSKSNAVVKVTDKKYLDGGNENEKKFLKKYSKYFVD